MVKWETHNTKTAKHTARTPSGPPSQHARKTNHTRSKKPARPQKHTNSRRCAPPNLAGGRTLRRRFRFVSRRSLVISGDGGGGGGGMRFEAELGRWVENRRPISASRPTDTGTRGAGGVGMWGLAAAVAEVAGRVETLVLVMRPRAGARRTHARTHALRQTGRTDRQAGRQICICAH